jgi:hypothetical protein
LISPAGWVIEREFDSGAATLPRPTKDAHPDAAPALILSIAANLALLIFFKYSHFAVVQLQPVLESLGFTQATITSPCKSPCRSGSASTPSSP